CTFVPASPSPPPRPAQAAQPAPSGPSQIAQAVEPAPSGPLQIAQAANVRSTPVVKIDEPPQRVPFPVGDMQAIAASEDAVLVISGTERELDLALFDATTLNPIGKRRKIVAAIGADGR